MAKDSQIYFRLSGRERDDIREAAAREGVSVSEMLRAVPLLVQIGRSVGAEMPWDKEVSDGE